MSKEPADIRLGLAVANDRRLIGLLGITVALAWPLYAATPDPRLGGMLMLNSLLYACLLFLATKLLQHVNLSKLVGLVSLTLILVYLPPSIQALNLDTYAAKLKTINLLVTHAVFLFAGIAAGRNFQLFLKYFLITMILIILANLAIELYPDFELTNRSRIGVLGGQGFSRILAVAAIGLIVAREQFGFLRYRLVSVAVLLASLGLILFTGARSSILGVVAALTVYFLDNWKKWAVFALACTAIAVVTAILVSIFYLDTWRPVLIKGPGTGIGRTLLSFDLFYMDQVGTESIASIVERAQLIRDSLKIAAAHPLGTGFGGYEVYASVGRESSPHNILIEILVEMGLIVGCIYILLITLIIGNCSRYVIPFVIYLVVFFQFSGDIVDMRQLLFFLGVAIYQIYIGETRPWLFRVNRD